MRHFLRIIIGLSVVLLALLATALSCNKDDGGNNSGNNGNGNGITPTEPAIRFVNFDESVAVQLPDGNIQLKANGFPKAAATNTGVDIYKPYPGLGASNIGTTSAASFKRAFDITITGGEGGATPATGGLILVGPGNLAYPKDFFIRDYGRPQEGIRGFEPRKSDTPNGLLKKGLNILGLFMSTGYPYGPNPGTNAADISPFAFTETTQGVKTQPLLFCRTTITTITDFIITASIGGGPELTGSQTASCYVGAVGAPFTGQAAEDWFKEAKMRANFKKKFSIAVAGIRTDNKNLYEIGLSDNDVRSLRVARTSEQTEDLVAKNSSAYKKVSIELVKGDFAYTSPPAGTIEFINFDTSVAEMVGDTIQLKASGFPSDVVHIWRGLDIVHVSTNTANLKKAFDVTISADGNRATGGLLFVGPGNLAAIDDFSIYGVDKDLYRIRNNEGILSSKATSTANGLFQVGWNVFYPFMNSSDPSTQSLSAAADASPFGFTEIYTRPFVVCRMTVGTITSYADMGAGTVQDDTKLTGGQIANCYVGVLGDPFTGDGAYRWLKRPAGNDFKKKFEIAVVGVQTDAKTIGDLGFLANPTAFRDGLTSEELIRIASTSPSAYKRASIELIKDPGFTHTLPPAALKFDNFATGVRTNTAGDTIQIKAGAFPTTAANVSVTASANNLVRAAANSLKHVFDITITDTGGNAAIGGLVMVGPGNYTKVDDFVDTTGQNALPANFKEGYATGTITNRDAGAGEFQKAGWSHYGVFMNDTAPTAVGADASPLAFTASGGSQPFLFCRTTLSRFNTEITMHNNTFAGGQTAHCYIGSKGTAFGTQSATWLGATASATFKKTFNIAIGAIKTDRESVEYVLPGADYLARAQAIIDGLNSTELADIMTRYSHTFKKMSVTIVDDSTW